MLQKSKSLVLLASSDLLMREALKGMMEDFGLHAEVATNGEQALSAVGAMRPGCLILLDGRLPGMRGGRLLAALEEVGAHKLCPIGLISDDQVGEEWMGWLADGILDGIVPRDAGPAGWRIHLTTMRRGHRLSLELEQMREAGLAEVGRDRLTGTLNRAGLMGLLFRETDRQQRLGGGLCLMLVDIDDFGHWNAELGMEACDDLLRQVGERVGRMLRSYDLLGRVGNDEFLLALPGCSQVSATMLAARLRLEVFGEEFQTGEVLVRLTGSFGIASSGGRSPVVVLREVEQALGQAKRMGPDAIRCADEGKFCARELPGPMGAGGAQALMPW